MIVAIIQAKNTDEILSEIQKAGNLCDAFELRLDYLTDIDIKAISEVREKIEKPVIFTLRPENQGGLFSGSEEQRLSSLLQIASTNPNYVDIEHTVSKSFLSEFHTKYPDVKIIRSYHNFDETPTDLKGILHSLQHPSCHIYKIATFANSSVDNLLMLHFLKDNASQYKIAAHCMGELGVPSRILGPILQSILQYASLDESQSPAPGVLSLKTLNEIYHAKDINSQTKIYALLGDPIEQSRGHIFHNDIFHTSAINAVYVKFRVTKEELTFFLTGIKGLPFKGFSITMPLKREAISFIDKYDNDCNKIGAINTIRVEKTGFSGLNTDGAGALNALEKIKKVTGKKMLILGAGGSARAIAFESKKRNAASIVIINRTLSTAAKFANEFGCLTYDFYSPDISTLGTFDFVINTLPATTDSIDQIVTVTAPCLSEDTVFMDINYTASQSKLTTQAIAHGCTIVDGNDMFVEQALMQQEYWG